MLTEELLASVAEMVTASASISPRENDHPVAGVVPKKVNVVVELAPPVAVPMFKYVEPREVPYSAPGSVPLFSHALAPLDTDKPLAFVVKVAEGLVKPPTLRFIDPSMRVALHDAQVPVPPAARALGADVIDTTALANRAVVISPISNERDFFTFK